MQSTKIGLAANSFTTPDHLRRMPRPLDCPVRFYAPKEPAVNVVRQSTTFLTSQSLTRPCGPKPPLY